MRRTQIYLDEEIHAYLESEKRRTGQSFSEIIRNDIKSGIQSRAGAILRRMEKASGCWKTIDITPEEQVRQLRQDRKT